MLTLRPLTKLVLEALCRCGTKLVIDDIHILDVSIRDGRLANNNLKHLANFCASPFVYTGGRSPELLPLPRRLTKGERYANRRPLHPFRTAPLQHRHHRRRLKRATAAKSMEEALGLFKYKPGTLD
ncbi:hypothetical protein ACH4TP_39190 [Streptomyces sp. NPDC021012]|uniref:hypothetical protein n=1 Tax=Streptomyces sp. NPDC021012 TaxID=3365107 RepID=UPI00379CA451